MKIKTLGISLMCTLVFLSFLVYAQDDDPIVITAVGLGKPPSNIESNSPRAKLMARRAAQVVGLRNLSEKLNKIFKTDEWSQIYGFQYLEERILEDGSIEVKVGLPLSVIASKYIALIKDNERLKKLLEETTESSRIARIEQKKAVEDLDALKMSIELEKEEFDLEMARLRSECESKLKKAEADKEQEIKQIQDKMNAEIMMFRENLENNLKRFESEKSKEFDLFESQLNKMKSDENSYITLIQQLFDILSKFEKMEEEIKDIKEFLQGLAPKTYDKEPSEEKNAPDQK